MKTYIITPTSGGSSYNISAAKYRFDEANGHHYFYNEAGELVANLINVSVREQSAS